MGEGLLIAAVCVDCAGEVGILEEPVQVGQPQASNIPMEGTVLNTERLMISGSHRGERGRQSGGSGREGEGGRGREGGGERGMKQLTEGRLRKLSSPTT